MINEHYSETSTPFDAFLLQTPSGNELARQRQSLFATAPALAALTARVSCTSEILETELRTADRFLASDEDQPATKLHQTLSRIVVMLAVISAAVDVYCNECLGISTPPGNPQPCQDPQSTISNYPPKLSSNSTPLGTVQGVVLHSPLCIK